MFFPLYREYNENPFAVLECPEFTQRLYDLTDYHSAIVSIDDTTKYIWVSSKDGSGYNEIGGQGLPTPELIDAASATGWRIPDASDESFYIYFDGGTRVSFKHFVNGNRNVLRIEPAFGIRHVEEYIEGSFGYQTNLFNYDYDPADVGSITLHVFHCTTYGFRDYGGYAGNYRPAYVFFIRIRSRGGSLGDPIYLCAFQDDLLTLSDGEQKAPNAPNKTTRRGGMGTGSYPNRVNGERMNVAIRNGSTSYGGNGDGLTYYRLTKSALHAVLNKVYQIGIARDNAYLRQCLVCAYLLPDLTITADTGYGVSVANERVPVGQVEIYDIEHISQPRNAYYDFTNNKKYSVGWDNYTDFTNTKLTLYLPFVGAVNIDVNACQYSRLSVTYYIDVYNGNIVYWVYTRSYDSPTDTLYGVYSGNCAIQIPLYGVGESGSILGKVTNMVNAVATGSAAVMTGNPRMAVKAVGDTMSAIESAIPTYIVERNGTIDTNSVSLQGWRISLKISKPKVLRCDSVQLIGLPSYYKARISEIPSGYHVVGAVDVDTIPNATAAEKEEIRRILMGGFYK